MKRIDFKNFVLFTDVKKSRKQTVDVRESLADLIYVQATGVRGHALALKIYNSDGEVELDGGELDMLNKVMKAHCSPAVIDAFISMVKD